MYDLRGCIGCLSPVPLSCLKDYACKRSRTHSWLSNPDPNPKLRLTLVLRLTPYAEAEAEAEAEAYMSFTPSLYDTHIVPSRIGDFHHFSYQKCLFLSARFRFLSIMKMPNMHLTGRSWYNWFIGLVNFEINYCSGQVGKHGITIEFRDPSNEKSYSAVFLPEVASEQGAAKIDANRVQFSLFFDQHQQVGQLKKL